MALAIHWKVPFKSISGTSYTLNIYEEGYTGSAVNLTAAAAPFVTSENNSTDILEPVRISTGTISIINEGNLSGLLPATPKARRVTLVSGNTTLWQGYLKQQQMTQPWAQTPYEMQLPVVSALGILDNKIEKGDVPDRARIAEYLRLALASTGATYTTIVFPADLCEQAPEEEEEPQADVMWRIGLQDRNWFSYRNENVLDPDESRFDGMTWLDILTELMRAFGYTMYERGTTIYIISRRSTSYLSIAASDLATLADNGEVTETAVTVNTTAIGTLQVGGADGAIDLMESKRRVVVESQINPFDEDSVPVADTLYLDYLATMQIRKQATDVAGWYYYSKTLGLYGPSQDNEVWTFRSFQDGDEVEWDAQDLSRDYNIAVYCRDSQGEDRIVINYNNVSNASAWGTDWVCSIKSASESLFAGGYLALHMGVEFFEGVGMSVAETHRAKFMLRLGEYYYNATNHSWSTTPSQFVCAINDGLIVPPSSYESGDNDSVKFNIPADGIYGDVELYIYNPYSTSPLSAEHEAVYEFTKLDIRYVDYEDNVYQDEYVTDTNRFVVAMNTFAKEDAEISPAITSFIKQRMGYGVMIAPDFSKPLGKVYDAIDEDDMYVEEVLVNTAQGCYESAQEILTIPLRYTSALEAADLYSWHSANYRYLSVSRSWADDLQYIQIYKTL